MTEKSFESRLQACEKAENKPFPFDVISKKMNSCSDKPIQQALAEKRANEKHGSFSQDWYSEDAITKLTNPKGKVEKAMR
ncbi:MAG: hypothetical protein ACD_4C00409G0003 [uncultured bacterium (gcode 4)]|uniref:Uncharacterized protein n=1 Tax=uncultured bacterium (gcode 4) TaxID=1234023 RepID=K2FTG2_9BACT|nr:MAG: hypothetical protein ACD_4C00409G0003 [uncultured bacterium (gcode 4)]